MDYISIAQAAERWGISRRRVQMLCAEGRIEGLERLGSTWAIPKSASKPPDARVKTGKYIGLNKRQGDSCGENKPQEL